MSGSPRRPGAPRRHGRTSRFNSRHTSPPDQTGAAPDTSRRQHKTSHVTTPQATSHQSSPPAHDTTARPTTRRVSARRHLTTRPPHRRTPQYSPSGHGTAPHVPSRRYTAELADTTSQGGTVRCSPPPPRHGRSRPTTTAHAATPLAVRSSPITSLRRNARLAATAPHLTPPQTSPSLQATTVLAVTTARRSSLHDMSRRHNRPPHRTAHGSTRRHHSARPA
jgi:hypothetical protein